MNVTNFFNKVGTGRFVNSSIPIADIKYTFPPDLSKQQLRGWAILDTFDMFSPQFDNPQTIVSVRNWFTELGMEINFASFINYGGNCAASVV